MNNNYKTTRDILKEESAEVSAAADKLLEDYGEMYKKLMESKPAEDVNPTLATVAISLTWTVKQLANIIVRLDKIEAQLNNKEVSND